MVFYNSPKSKSELKNADHMRILHVITSLSAGGAEKLLVDLLPQLKSHTIDVDLCLFDGGNTPFRQQIESKGIKTISFGVGNSVYNPWNIIRLKKLLSNYDIIHTHNYSPQLYVALASGGHYVKLVTTEHSTSNRRRSINGFSVIDRWMYNQYDRIICISKKAENNLRNYIHSDSTKILTVNNGIDTKTYVTARPLINFKPNGTKAITMVAGFRWEKDQDTLIRSLSYLPDYFHLYLVGDGTRRSECEKKAVALKLEKRVHFLGMRTDVPQILKASDYIVMSSHFEGLSLSSLEGMASGRPFLASDVDGLKEVVKGAGILFEHKNPDDLAAKILQIEKDPNSYLSIAERCSQRASLYDISEMAESYIKVYNSL